MKLGTLFVSTIMTLDLTSITEIHSYIDNISCRSIIDSNITAVYTRRFDTTITIDNNFLSFTTLSNSSRGSKVRQSSPIREIPVSTMDTLSITTTCAQVSVTLNTVIITPHCTEVHIGMVGQSPVPEGDIKDRSPDIAPAPECSAAKSGTSSY